MLFKFSAVCAVIVMLLIAVRAQTTPAVEDDLELRRRIQKQFLLNQSEGRLREIDFAGPRVLLRFKIAAWLWDQESEYFGRAEDLASAAIDDLYKNRSEVPPVYFSALSSGIFALLERKSPKLANILRDKYDVAGSEKGGIQDQLVLQADNDKAAVDIAIRSLSSGRTFDSQLPTLLHRLKKRKSSEIIRLLDALISIEERVPGRFDLGTLTSVSPYFAEQNLRPESVERYAHVIVRRVKIVSQSLFADFDAWLDLLNFNSRMIKQRVSALASEVEVLQVVLNSRISRRSQVERDRNDRISNSPDKLEALVKEAEEASDPTVKYDLFRRAANLAMEKGLFRRSTDLAIKFAGVDIGSDSILSKTQDMEFAQLLERVTEKALNAAATDAAVYSVERHQDNDRRANGYLEVLTFLVKSTAFEAARDMFQTVIQSIATVEDPTRRAILSFKLMPIAQRLDPTLVFEVNLIASRSLNAITSLGPEDVPGTENSKKYVTAILDVIWNLLPALVEISVKDRLAASDLVARIETKEIRAIADFALGVATLDGLRPDR